MIKKEEEQFVFQSLIGKLQTYNVHERFRA